VLRRRENPRRIRNAQDSNYEFAGGNIYLYSALTFIRIVLTHPFQMQLHRRAGGRLESMQLAHDGLVLPLNL